MGVWGAETIACAREVGLAQPLHHAQQNQVACSSAVFSWQMASPSCKLLVRNVRVGTTGAGGTPAVCMRTCTCRVPVGLPQPQSHLARRATKAVPVVGPLHPGCALLSKSSGVAVSSDGVAAAAGRLAVGIGVAGHLRRARGNVQMHLQGLQPPSTYSVKPHPIVFDL